MELLYKSGDEEVKPNTYTYTGKHYGRVLSILFLSQNVNILRNDLLIYYTPPQSGSAVIDALARSSERGAAQRAEKILKRMETLHVDGDVSVKPNTRTFNAVINGMFFVLQWHALYFPWQYLVCVSSRLLFDCPYLHPTITTAWAQSQEIRSPQKAEGILKRMEGLYRDGDKSCKPSVVSYTSAINAWAGSTESEKACKARKILLHMIDLYHKGDRDVKPNVVPFTSVINACAGIYGTEAEKREALEIAYDTLKEVEGPEFGPPNHVTYATFLKACWKLVPSAERRRKLVATIFRKCCQRGQVNESVLTQLRNAAPKDLFLSLMGGVREEDIDSVTILNLPSEWSRNVKRSRKRPAKP